MGKPTFDEEVTKRFKRRLKMNQKRLSSIIVFNLIGYVMVYLILFFIRGVDFANEYILLAILFLIGVQGLGLIGYVFNLVYNEIPAEIDKEKDAPVTSNPSITLKSVSIIQEYRTNVTNVYSISPDQGSASRRASEQLALSVERVPTNILRNQGKNVKALALLVTSQESRKIIELKAKIDFRHSYHEPGFTVFSHGYDLNSFLFWDDEKIFKKEIELRPNIQKILVICEFLRYKTSDGDLIDMAILTSDPYPVSINFSKESIFQIRIMFQGKLEGEFEYRTLLYKDLFYTEPEDQRILFLDDAEKVYSDIPQELLQRGKNESAKTKNALQKERFD